MSKGLQALKELKKRYGKNFSLQDDERTHIIEKELKDYEKLTSKPVILHRRTHRQAQALIDTICKNYKEVKITNLEDEKKLKALEIIKNKKVDVNAVIYYLKMGVTDEQVCHWYNECVIYVVDEEPDRVLNEEDLVYLKEVLL